MTIAEVSKKYDISADTLRYYEPVSYTHLWIGPMAGSP